MFEALLSGKLSREQRNMEDLLTSMVFGTLQHFPHTLVEFLSKARSLDGNSPLAGKRSCSLGDVKFWPWLAETGCLPCEPDVLMDLVGPGGELTSLLLEVKYRSGKSSFDDGSVPSETRPARVFVRDQLAREWQNLNQRTRGREAWVIYVTTSHALPRVDIEEAQAELLRKTKKPGAFLWLSLRSLLPIIRSSQDPWLTKLGATLARLDLVPFEGVTLPAPRVPSWRFTRWSLSRGAPAVIETPWRFSR